MIMALTPFATCLPLKIAAAFSISEIRPLVQEPITTWSISISGMSLNVLVFEGR